MKSSLDTAFRIKTCVGEGPLWDDTAQELVWIDVLEGKVFRFNPRSFENREYLIGKHVGAVALTNTSKLLVAARDEFLFLETNDSSLTSIRTVITNHDFRFNDGRVDSHGRFVIGTMGYSPEPGTAALYSYTFPDIFEVKLNGVGLSNGLCWGESYEEFFYIDTLTSQISKYDYDVETGRLSSPTSVIKFEKSHGSPDGMTIDIEGNLWIGFWGGGCVRKISPSGKIIEEITLPVSRVTSAAFGGDKLDQLYITTASYQLTNDEFLREPLAGSLFVLETDTHGRPENRIKIPL